MRIGVSNLHVEVINFYGIAGYHVAGLYADSSDGMYDRISHPAVFLDYARAVRFLAKVVRGKINFSNWRGSDSVCAAFQADDKSPGYYSVL